MNCVNCYQEIPDGSKFCPHCGALQPENSGADYGNTQAASGTSQTAYSAQPETGTDSAQQAGSQPQYQDPYAQYQNAQNYGSGYQNTYTSDYQNTQDLLCAADMLISDYSSIIWDYSYTYRPCFLYVPDVKEYTSRYELITPIEEWGYPIATSMQELSNLILSYREEEYVSRIKRHHEILGSYERGNATKRFCDYLIPEIAKS